MQIFINSKYKNRILFAVLTSLFFFSINTEKALSGGGDVTQSTTEQASVSSPITQNPGSVTVTPTTLLQTGSNNYANVNSNIGSLNYPNCGGSCGFAIMRTTPTNNINGTSSNQIEGIIGVIHSFSSPDQKNAETNRQLIDIQKQRSESEIASNYIKAIADACQAKDSIRAELSAKGLARIWNVDYKTLLHPSCGS
ncbi:hypothetical protein VB638_08905 [Dolichospermum sp. UHCC 0684]|jgi:hypothetical protein|uniref:hypothetical protein n=1 Tax=unclassified Dolichospermum TaxID=2622029 RepID=UPI0011E6AA60|nr:MULTISPECIES: hypothetical protein [unclassified Dolichospermum]MBJ7296226.1 hypothetical protein [Dolichospermum sp.]MEA5529709.1 hypothetical protein [Dolichospermum sp. UHCC 0684]MTJ34736.1 hypothetical protein [Dolichospermum sp. UHCC 0260]QEI42660.1 hypothetical protein BMF77_03271 [Dolichospermum sp. UHCC 0315A]